MSANMVRIEVRDANGRLLHAEEPMEFVPSSGPEDDASSEFELALFIGWTAPTMAKMSPVWPLRFSLVDLAGEEVLTMELRSLDMDDVHTTLDRTAELS